MAGLPIPDEFLYQPLPPDAALVPPELAYQPQPQVVPDPTLPAPVPIAPAEPAFPTGTVSQGLPVPPEFTYQPAQAAPPQVAPVEPVAAFQGGGAPAPMPAPVAAPAEQPPPAAEVNPDPILAAGDARAAKATALGREKERQVAAEQQRIEQDQAWEAQKRAELETAYQQHAAELDRLAAAKVDPKRMAKEQSLFENIATAIGFMSGGLLAVRNGSGVNEFQKYYQHLVDQDLQSQQAELDNRRSALGMKSNLLGDLRAQFGDEVAARHAYRAVRAKQGADQLEAMALQLDSPIFQRDAAVQAAAMRAQADKDLKAATQQQWENNFKKAQLAEQIRSNKAQERLAGARLQADKDAAGVKAEGIPIKGPSGKVIGYATSPDRADRERQADEARKIVDNQARGKVLYDEAKELFKDGWDLNPYSEKRKRQEKMAADWVNFRKTSTGDFSAPNAADWQAYGIKDQWGPDNPMAEFDQGYRNSRISGAAALTARGIANDALVGEGLADPPDFEEKAVRPGELPGKSVTEIAGDAKKIATTAIPMTDTSTGEVTYRSPEAVQFLQRYGERYRPSTDEELKKARGAAEAEAKQKQADDAKRAAFQSGALR